MAVKNTIGTHQHRVNVRVSGRLWAKLKHLAAERELSISDVLRELIRCASTSPEAKP